MKKRKGVIWTGGNEGEEGGRGTVVGEERKGRRLGRRMNVWEERNGGEGRGREDDFMGGKEGEEGGR